MEPCQLKTCAAPIHPDDAVGVEYTLVSKRNPRIHTRQRWIFCTVEHAREWWALNEGELFPVCSVRDDFDPSHFFDSDDDPMHADIVDRDLEMNLRFDGKSATVTFERPSELNAWWQAGVADPQDDLPGVETPPEVE